MKVEEIRKYIIKEGKTDLLSSLKRVNEDILKEEFSFYEVNTLDKLAKAIIEDFSYILDSSKDDPFSVLFFRRLLEHENTSVFVPLKDDLSAFWCFAYEREHYLSYYIADEIKEVIKKVLGI